MFDSIRADDAGTRLRFAALLPLAAFLFAQIYFSAAPLLPRVPSVLFWMVTLVVLSGAVAGAVAIVRVVRSGAVRGRAIAWLVAAVVCDLVCLRLWLAMVFPWL